MKRILITLFAVMIGVMAFASKKGSFKAYAFCTRDNETMEYTPWEETDVKGYLDMYGERIVIYSEELQVFKIDFYNEDEWGNFMMQCINNNNTDCIVRAEREIIDGEAFYHLYIDYSDITLGYVIQFESEKINTEGLESICPTQQPNTSEQSPKQ